MGNPLSLVGAAFSAYGSYRRGKEQKSAYLAQAAQQRAQTEAEVRNLIRQAEADRLNADLAESDAKELMRITSINEDIQRRQSSHVISSMKSALIQNNVSGTFASDLIEKQALIDAEFDAINIRNSGINEAKNLLRQRDNLLDSSKQNRKNAETVAGTGYISELNLIKSGYNAYQSGRFGAVSNLLGGYIKYRTRNNI